MHTRLLIRSGLAILASILFAPQAVAVPVSLIGPGDAVSVVRGTGEPVPSDASSENERVEKAVDLDLSTKHFAKVPAGKSVGFLIAPSVGISRAERLRFATGNDVPDRDPVQVSVEGSNDNGRNFTKLYEGFSGLEEDPGRSSWGRWIEIEGDRSYKMYRILFSGTRGPSDGMQYAEVALEGMPDQPPKLVSTDDLKISFRAANQPVPEGFRVDSGRDFSLQKGLSYGWDSGVPRTIQRKLYNENEVLSTIARFSRDSRWQIALENGLYEVGVCVGSSDDPQEQIPLAVEGEPYFTGQILGKNIFLKQRKTVEVRDGKLTLEVDASRVPKDWEAKNRFFTVPFVEIKRVEKARPESEVEWSVQSDPATDFEFYGFLPDIVSTARPRSDLRQTLWYDQPAKIWEAAVPLGNGRLGAMVFGNPVHELIQFNEDTLWNGAPGLPMANPDGKQHIDAARRLIFENRPESEVWDYIFSNVFHRKDGQFGPFMFDYMNGGDLLLDYPEGKIADYYRSLDLSNGISTTTYVRDGVRYTQEIFTSAVAGVAVIRIMADQPGSVSLVGRARDIYEAKITTDGLDTVLVDGKAPEKKGILGAIRYQRRMKFIAEGGRISTDDKSVSIERADAVTILVSIRTNFVNYRDVSANPEERTRREIDEAASISYAALKEAHIADFRGLYDRMTIDLGPGTTLDQPTDRRIALFRQSNDPQMAAMVLQFARYLMISCSRPGTQAANLQGIWNVWTYGAWGGKYTVNINIQMIYWLADVANLGECNEPFFDLIAETAEAGRSSAQAYYGARGWVCHHNTDLWRYTHPIDGKAGMWPMASAWFCDHLWDHYLYTEDKDFLRRAYPIMRDASLFYVDSLVTDPRSGYLVTAPSVSPENGGIRAAPTMDVQLLNSLFRRTAQAAQILGLDPDLQLQFEESRRKLPPMMIGKWGQLQEWTDGDFDRPDDKHRHVSHLYGLHPGDQIDSRRTPDLFKAAKVSLLARGDEATGWSLGWKVNFWARLRDGEHAYDILKLLIKPAYNAQTKTWGSGLYPNFFDSHPPFQIDGNFGAAVGILEMLLQSQNGELDILPALPSIWPTGSVKGMKARGALTVDFAWKDGKLLSLRLLPARDGKVRVRYGETVREIEIQADRAVTLGEKLTTI